MLIENTKRLPQLPQPQAQNPHRAKHPAAPAPKTHRASQKKLSTTTLSISEIAYELGCETCNSSANSSRSKRTSLR